MAKKKTTKKSARKSSAKKATAKKAAKKSAPRKKTAAKPAKKVARKKPSAAARKTSPAKKSAAKKSSPAKSTRRKPESKAVAPAKPKSRGRSAKTSKLGRPRIPGDAKIDSVFRKEYDARQLCEYLGVETIRDLEKFAPEEIIKTMMKPIVQTVGKIRKILAVANRSLATDEEFAIEFRDLYAPPDED